MRPRIKLQWVMLGIIISIGMGCGKTPTSTLNAIPNSCAPQSLTVVTGATGRADVFVLDPISASDQVNLSPSSSSIDQFKVPVKLSRLNGKGVLSGQYVQVVNGL